MESNYLKENRNQIFKKYTQGDLENDIRNFLSGSGKLSKLLNHFFEEEMFKCRNIDRCGKKSLSPLDALNDDQVVDKILTFTRSKPKFYVGNDIANVKSFFRNAGRTAQKVSNFPVKEALEIYSKYSKVGDTIYDPSCGFGSRMCASLLSDRNYLGADPNESLVLKLEECATFITSKKLVPNSFKIYKSGSEVYIPELLNKVDLCFTSPPYFDTEDYGEDVGQSIVKYPRYEEWLSGFVFPMIDNCTSYTKGGGHIIFNIKNLTHGKKYKLYDAFFDYMSSKPELEFVEVMEMKQLSKRDYKGMHFTGVNTDFGVKEPVMVFKKK